MALTRAVVDTKATEYADTEPLYAVEAEQIETLGDAVAAGEYGWRDLEWVVQWYYRRFLGAYPDRQRRHLEAAYAENDFEAIRDAMAAAHQAAEPAVAVRQLTALSGIDVPVASAFLLYLAPEDYIVVGDREWTALYEAAEIDSEAPATVTSEAYQTYLDRCRAVGDRLDRTMWTLYRALWRLWKDAHD